jgi:hypothetical protein
MVWRRDKSIELFLNGVSAPDILPFSYDALEVYLIYSEKILNIVTIR